MKGYAYLPILALAFVSILGCKHTPEAITESGGESTITDLLAVIRTDCYPSTGIGNSESDFLDQLLIRFGNEKGCFPLRRMVYSNNRIGKMIFANNTVLAPAVNQLNDLSQQYTNLITRIDSSASEGTAWLFMEEVLGLESPTKLVDNSFFGAESKNIQSEMTAVFASTLILNFDTTSSAHGLIKESEFFPELISLTAKWIFQYYTFVNQETSNEIEIEQHFKNKNIEMILALGKQPCIGQVEQTLDAVGEFIRDHSIIKTNHNKSTIIPRFDPRAKYYNQNKRLLKYITDSCSGINYSESIKIDLAGGNLLMVDNMGLIGKDELYKKYLSIADTLVQKRLIALGIHNWVTMDSLELTTSITTKICTQLELDTIIWIGSDKLIWSLLREDKRYYQPFYHLDLFLLPIGATSSSQKENKAFRYVICLPDTSLIHFAARNPSRYTLSAVVRKIRTLRGNIIETADDLDVQLNNLGYTPFRDTVSLSVLFELSRDPNIERIEPSLNGLVEKSGERVKFYMPLSKVPIFKNSQKVIRKQLASIFTEVDTIPAKYKRDNGLRCRVVPLARN